MSGPVAIVTGAGSGVGRAVAVALGQEGHRLVLVGRRAEPLRETGELACRASAPAALEVPADVARAESAAHVVEEALAAFGRVDVLVNNAATCPSRPIEATDRRLLEQTFAVNSFAPALLVARLWPVFRAQGGGCVVNVSSMATVDPFPGLCVYAASKAALESLTRSIVNEGSTLGVRAYNLVLGAVETGMLRAVVSQRQLPTSRTLAPDQVALVVVECVLGRYAAHVGTTITVPGP